MKQHGRREPSSNEPMHAARATRQHTCKRYRPRRGTRQARSLGPSRVPPTGRNQHSRKSVAVATHPCRRRGSAPHPPAAASPPPCRRGCRPTGVAGGRPTARADRAATLPPAATRARDAPPGAGGRRRPPRRARDARGRRGARRARVVHRRQRLFGHCSSSARRGCEVGRTARISGDVGGTLAHGRTCRGSAPQGGTRGVTGTRQRHPRGTGVVP
mgnify:CR=1 FL=1